VRFDFTQQLGLRQEMGDKGIVATSLVFNVMPVELWSDPFATGVDRSATDVKSKGVRFAWDKIWGSNLRHPDHPGSGSGRGAQRPAI
jgi:hypothetical protein